MIDDAERRLGRSVLQAHVQQFFAGRAVYERAWQVGPIERSLPGFRVLVVEPGDDRTWTYVSCGAWEAPGHLEFAITAPGDDSAHVETLAMVANLHADPKYRLRIGAVLDIGRPFVAGSTCAHLLVSLPYPFGPAFERVTIGEHPVRISWLFAITKAEAAFARTHGVEMLEQRLEAAAVDMLDPKRASCV